MGLYRKKPVVIEAIRWWQIGDSPVVERFAGTGATPTYVQCKRCREDMAVHGWVDTLEGGHTVCPGDWIIAGVKGEHYPCKPDIFDTTYEAMEANND